MCFNFFTMVITGPENAVKYFLIFTYSSLYHVVHKTSMGVHAVR